MSPPDLYARAPLCRRGTIPVFSETSDYICNYEKIATDHLEAQNKTGQNPWIEERFWLEMEQSTADMIRKYAKPGQDSRRRCRSGTVFPVPELER